MAKTELAPGNVAVAPDGTVYFTLHQFYAPPFAVAKLEGGVVKRVAPELELVSPLGLAIDEVGTLWLLDNGLAQKGTPPRLVAHKPNDKTRVYALADATPEDAFVNDLVVDLPNRVAYIADPAGGSNAALIVLNLGDGSARRVLEGHESVVPEDLDLVIDGRPVTLGEDPEAIRPRIGVNPIAADRAMEWLYFGPMHGTGMYRVRTADLRNASLTKTELAARVERFADKPLCDGIAIDRNGTIYLGDLANNAIGAIDANGHYTVLKSDPMLSWIDAFDIGPDGQIYTVANQLHRSPPLHGGTSAARPPFLILRFAPPLP